MSLAAMLREENDRLKAEVADIRAANAIHNDAYGRMRLRLAAAKAAHRDAATQWQDEARLRRAAEAKLAKVVEEIETLMGGNPDALVSGAYLLAAAKGE